jgi:hypothetical protein
MEKLLTKGNLLKKPKDELGKLMAATAAVALSLPGVASCGAINKAPTVESVRQALDDGGVWVAPAAFRDNAGDGDIAIRPLVTIDGDPSCQQPGEKQPLDEKKTKLYVYEDGEFKEHPRHGGEEVTINGGVGFDIVQCTSFSEGTGALYDENDIPVFGRTEDDEIGPFFRRIPGDSPEAEKPTERLLDGKQ